MSSSTRVNLVINNQSNADVICTDISCSTFNDLTTGVIIKQGSSRTFTSDTNDRLFVTWEPTGSGIHIFPKHEIAMTCPKSSHNSACGITEFTGLQTYSRTGTPVTFTFNLGTKNLADWDNGDKNTGEVVAYGNCTAPPSDGGPGSGGGGGGSGTG